MSALKELSRYDRIVLPNDTKLLVRQEKDAPYTTLRIRIGYGHCHDPVELDGVAHFAEHMFFKSNSKYSKGEIDHKLKMLTGLDPNAATGQEEITTILYLMPPENLEMVMNVIASGINNPCVKRDEFERERGVIINELREIGHFFLYFDEVVGGALYPNHPYGQRFGRNIETISAIAPEHLDNIRNIYFKGQNVTVAIAGDVGDQHIKVAEELFGVNGSKPAPELSEVSPLDRDVFLKQRFTDIPGIDKSLNSVYHTFQLKPGVDGITLSILVDYLYETINSKLREEMGLVYSAWAVLASRHKINSFIVNVVGFKEDSVTAINRVIEEEIERVKQGEVDEKYLELRKHMVVLSYPRRFGTIENRADWILDKEIRGLTFDHQEYLDVVKAVTPENLINVTRKYLNGYKLTFTALLIN